MDLRETHLPRGLVHCGQCHQVMTQVPQPSTEPGYQCQPGCRARLLDAVVVADTVGRAILRHAPRTLPVTGMPTPPYLAAAYADRFIARVTVGATAADITLAWHATPVPPPGASAAHRIAMARHLTSSNPQRARQLLYGCLIGVNPAAAPADSTHAEAAALLAELHLTLGHPNAAVTWAAYAHPALTHLKGPTHPASLASLHLLATAHRSAGQNQRALHLYQQLAEHLATTDGPRAHRTLAINATIALVLHQLGHCERAGTLLADTIATHHREHPHHPATTRMTQHLTRIWRDCDANRHQHQEPRVPPR